MFLERNVDISVLACLVRLSSYNYRRNVEGGGKRGANAHAIFFQPKNIFFGGGKATELKRVTYFQNGYLGGVKTKKKN